MDIVFFPNNGAKPFTIEIGYFDTVLEIKEKIQKQHNIPISKQTLVFNGTTLQDELNVHHSDILDRSRIQLQILDHHPSENNNNNNNNINNSNHHVNSVIKKIEPTKKIHLLVKMPILKSAISVEMEGDDTIKKLKDKICGMEGVASNLLCVHSNGVEFADHRTVRDCELSDFSVVEVSIVKSNTTSGGGSNGSAKNLKIQVLLNDGKQEKIPVEVNYLENVGELRKELERLNPFLHLNLPKDGYFFIHKQNVMDEDRSFRWHHVGFNDTIEIFCGSISGGL